MGKSPLQALRVIVDTREQRPFAFAHPLLAGLVVVERGTLATGDYACGGLEGRIAVERKSLDDLIGSITSGRERFEREIARGAWLAWFWVVIEAGVPDVLLHRYQSRMSPWAALQTVGSWSTRYRVPFIFAGDRSGAEVLTYTLLRWGATRLAAEAERIADADRVAREAEAIDWAALPF